MNEPLAANPDRVMRQAVEIAVRLLVIAVLALWSFRIVAPFVNLVVWAAVIAVAIHPLFVKLAKRLGGRRKLAVTLLVLLGLLIIIAPVAIMSGSLVTSASDIAQRAADGTLELPPPPAKVQDWPLVGERLHAGWLAASEDLREFAQRHDSHLKKAGTAALGALAGFGADVLLFVLAVLVAGAFLLHADAGARGMTLLAKRLAGPGRGETLVTLSATTIRSVAVGVLGVAFIQSALAAAGMIFAGVPAAGLWALIVLLLAIVQLPPILVLLPLALWVFGSAESQVTAWIFLVYSLVVSASDTFLKPMLLGRGVDVPMIVILLGAIGGMMLSGIIGLFVGAVVLAMGYRLLTAWLEIENEAEAAARTGG
jgi:predicted PurR-regulated permease PerM